MFKNYWFFVILYIASFACSCRGNVDTNQFEKFKRDLPDDSTKKGSLFESICFIRDSLKLDTLENGYDSLQIRVWLRFNSDYRQKVIVIKNNKGIWKAFYYEFEPVYNKKTDSLMYFEKVILEKSPKIGWNVFMNKLYVYKILTLPDFSKVNGYFYPSTHNDVVAIEVSTFNQYRLYNYPSPASMPEFSEARSIEKILSLISQQFDIELKRDI